MADADKPQATQMPAEQPKAEETKKDTTKARRAERRDSSRPQVQNRVSKDRPVDMAPTPEEVDAMRDDLDPNLGERLAQEAVEKDGASGGDVKLVKDNETGAFSAVATPVENQSDNGKRYDSDRIIPKDTNAPDAGLTPDGRRIAE